jgi:hypothetical protein
MTTPLRQAYAAMTWNRRTPSSGSAVPGWARFFGSVSLPTCIPALVWPALALVLLATVFGAATGQRRLLARRHCRPLRQRGLLGVQGHPRAARLLVGLDT